MIFGVSVKDILAWIGGLTVVLLFIKALFDVIPKLNTLKADIYRKLSSRVKHLSLEKRAIASDIEAVVNNSVSHLQSELPPGWICKAKIDWVREEDMNDLDEGDIILRIKPLDDQDKNLMNGIYWYFKKTLFRGIREVIPKIPKKAAALHLSRRTIAKNHPVTIEDFERSFLDPAIIEDENISFYIESFNELDQRGYFTAVYLREISGIAERIRYKALRPELEGEIRNVTQHLQEFTRQYPKVPDNLWYRQSEMSSYGIMLVAQPVPWRKIDTYVKKAFQHEQNNLERLYVLGADQERSFVRRVIRAISKNTKYDLLELFGLYKDYRGENGGVCAVFGLSSSAKQMDEVVNSFF